MPIYVLRDKATVEQVHDMLAEHTVMIKVVADVRQGLLAGGGKMHADCEAVLLQAGGVS